MSYTKINTSAPVGIVGMKATPDQSIYTAVNYLCADADGIAAGTFVAPGTKTGEATASGVTAANLLGIVERVINYAGIENLNAVPQGDVLTIASHGDYYVAAPAAVAVGASVVCSAKGAIVASGTEGAVTTGWKYKTAATAAGDMVIISNW